MAQLTNEEFVTYIMNYSCRGGLCQPFIIEAIRYYCEQVTVAPKPTEDGDSIISAIAWYEIAEEILAKLKLNYESESNNELLSDERGAEGNNTN